MLIAGSRVASGQSQSADLPPPGRLIDIGGYRLHLYCSGTSVPGQPTVVLSAGSGDYATDWWIVQTAVADSTRVCSYDRAGFGWSDLGPQPHTLRQETYELDLLLKRGGERGPFVLVGHSLGGQVVRLFQEEHRTVVVGMVLVAPTHENTRLVVRGQLVQLRTLAQDRTVPPVHSLAEAPPTAATGEEAAACQLTAAPDAKIVRPYDQLPAQPRQYRIWLLAHPKCGMSDGEDYLPEELADVAARRTAGPQPLGAIPLIVVVPGRLSTPRGVSPEAWRREYADNMADLSRLSRNGRVVADSVSGHHVQLDNPRVVVAAIWDVLRDLRR